MASANVYFHNGDKLDATAVKFSIDRLMDPETKSLMRRFYEPVDRVEVLDPLTVRAHMKRPYAFFLHMVAAYRTGLVLYSPKATEKHSLEERKKGNPEAVVGCGPFKLVEWLPNQHLVMDRWEKYHKPGQPYVDRVILRVIKDPVTQLAAFKTGEVDFIASFSPEHVETIQTQNPEAQLLTGPETTIMAAMMKVTQPAPGEKGLSENRVPHPVFGDIRVRKAIGCYGLDRKEIVKIAFNGKATPWVGMFGPGVLETTNVNHFCPYDPEEAKRLLTKAGYGAQNPLKFRILTDTEKSVFNVIATVIKEQMERLGVAASINLVDKVTLSTALRLDGDFDMFVEDLLSLLTVDNNAYISVANSSVNLTRHTDTKIDDYYFRYASEMDSVKRRAIAKELQEYMADKLYWNVISGSPFYQVAQRWVKGYHFNSEFEIHFETVWLEK